MFRKEKKITKQEVLDSLISLASYVNNTARLEFYASNFELQRMFMLILKAIEDAIVEISEVLDAEAQKPN